MTIKQFEGPLGALRVLMLGERPAAVGRDLCAALGLKNPKQAMTCLEDDESATVPLQTTGGEQQTRVVFEPGIYRLIFRSRKKEAEEFKRWVFHEVLPTIQKTGRYELALPTGRGKRTLPDWVEGLGVDLREQGWLAEILLQRASRAAKLMGYQCRSFRTEDGLMEYPEQVLAFAEGLVTRDARAPVNREFFEHFPQEMLRGAGGEAS